MTFELGVVVALLGFGGGIVAGLVGISGAVLMIPLLLYGPPLLGVGELTVRTVAAIAIVQGLFASTSGLIAHRRSGYLNRRIAFIGGPLVAAGALAGGVFSRWAPEISLLAIFASMATLAIVIMLLPGGRDQAENEAGFQFPRAWRLGIFFPEGLMAGMVGVGGGFVTVPILNRIMRVPLRIAISNTLAMSWFGVSAGFIGKAVTGQVPLWLSVAVVLGAVPGAQLGAWLNRRISGAYLRYVLVVLLVVIAVRIWLETLTKAGVV